LLAGACSADKTENAGELDRDEPLESTEPQESNVVFLWKDGPWTYSSRRPILAAVPAINIDDEPGVASEDTAPSPVTTLLSNAAYADDVNDQSDIVIEDEDGIDDHAISFAGIQDDEADHQGEIVLTSSGCSLKPHRPSASNSSKEAAAPLEIMLTDTACKLKTPSSDAVAFGKTKAFPTDMVLSTKTPGCDIEESLYFTIGGMIIPSFFAEAAGHAVKTHTMSYDTIPSGWEASIDEIGAAFEKSSALLAYLASHSDETAMIEAFKSMPEQQSEFFSEEIKSARAKGYCLFAHLGRLDGLFSVAVPVFADDEATGAVGIFVPRALTCSDNLEKHLLPQLWLMADAVAQSSKEAMKATEATETETSIAMAA
ncbi:MAG: hypothetical protein ACR2Q4_20775, partial [Geminicoccaceae bacterium]